MKASLSLRQKRQYFILINMLYINSLDVLIPYYDTIDGCDCKLYEKVKGFSHEEKDIILWLAALC